jgi:hypothetical protein
MGSETNQTALPLLQLKINKAIVMTVELKDTLYSMHAKGTPKEMNSLGARAIFKLRVNPNSGNQGEGDYFREPGKHNFKQAVIGFTRDNISHGANGDYLDNIENTDAIGGKLKELMADNVLYLKKQRDIDFCHGDGVGSRGLISSWSVSGGNTTVTFDSAEGTRFLDEDEIYFVVLPADGTVHGVTTGHRCLSITSSTVAVFVGDMTAGTTVAAADILVKKATADNETSWNRALYGYDYFFLDSGPYFGLSKDTDRRLRGLRVNGGGRNVSFSLLEKGRTKWFYRWNEEMPQSLIDAVPPAQQAAYKLLGYSLRRIDGGATSFDGALVKVTDGNLTMHIDANLLPTKWRRYDQSTIERYEFKPTGIWRRDGLTYRTVQGNNTNKDEIYWIIDGKEQMFCNNPARGIEYYNLGTAGVETGV